LEIYWKSIGNLWQEKLLSEPRNGVWLYEWFAYFGLPVEQSIRSMRYWDYSVAGMMMVVPAYRPFVSMIEKLCEENGWDIDDVSFTHSESYQNQARNALFW
jgi:hypothetical protein